MCRIIGAVLIISGLYLVLWGKSEEAKLAKQKMAIQPAPDHGSNRAVSDSAKTASSLTQPLLTPSSENV